MNQGTKWALLMQKNLRRKSHAWALKVTHMEQPPLFKIIEKQASRTENTQIYLTVFTSSRSHDTQSVSRAGSGIITDKVT
jgi:hypothetical protein